MAKKYNWKNSGLVGKPNSKITPREQNITDINTE